MLLKSSLSRRIIVLSLLLSITALPMSLALARSDLPQISGELLTNPGFEQPYEQVGTADIFVANGWTAWYLTPGGTDYPTACPDNAPVTCKPYQVPGYRNTQPQNTREPARARSGDSQSWGTAYAIYIAGVYQRITNLTPGTALRFSAYLQGFNCDDDRGCFGGVGQYGYSYEPGNMMTRVGIDPTGGTDAFSPGVVWSSYLNPLDAFALQQVEAVAKGNAVTVFVWSSPTFPEKHTQIYLDDASLVSIGQGTLSPTSPAQPAGTSQPLATVVPGSNTYTIQAGDGLFGIAFAYNLTLDQLLALNPGLTRDSILQIGQVINVGGAAAVSTPAVSPTSVPTSAPTTASTTVPTTSVPTAEPTSALTPEPTISSPLPTPTPAVSASGVCLLAFNDDNNNGTRESGEALVAGVQFVVKGADGTAVTTYTSDGQQEPHCLTGLADGRYTVDAIIPADRQATTEVHWSLSLLSGTSVNVNIGNIVSPAATATAEVEITATPEATAAAQGGSNAFPLIAGIALVVIAGIALFIGLRSRQKPV
ncbi:MAG TPA: LysM peptidoglycan-binding domain-containing protein [Anaerolineae bacterium]|nr:LysM peptidoglycan-binding domain-containing protein [Anaerolineae bacterium]